MARLRKLIRWPAFGALALILLFTSQDVVRLNVAQQASAPYIYDMIGWHARNFLGKWTHQMASWRDLFHEHEAGEGCYPQQVHHSQNE